VYNIGGCTLYGYDHSPINAQSVTRQYSTVFKHQPWVDVSHQVMQKGKGYDYGFRLNEIK